MTTSISLIKAAYPEVYHTSMITISRVHQPTNMKSRILKECHGLTERAGIRRLRHNCHLVDLNHIRGSLRVQSIDVDSLTLPHTHHILLAVLRQQTALVVIVEEAVQTSTVDEDVGRVVEVEADCLVACSYEALFEGRVGVAAVWGPGIESAGVVLGVPIMMISVLASVVDTIRSTYMVSLWMTPIYMSFALAIL